MKKIKIGLLAACDRNNYGDILFPIIFKKYFEKENYDFEYYGLIESDISYLGGPKTKALNMSEIDKNDFMIVCGGDTLSATWDGAGFCFIENKVKLYMLRGLRKILKIDLNKYFQKKIAKKFDIKMPYNISNLDYNNTKVIYNAVGGNAIKKLNPNEKKYLKEQLENSEYVSVRADNVKNDLLEIGVNKEINVSPDSAIIMSEVFSIETLKSKLSKNFKKVEKDYIVFQIGEGYAQNSFTIKLISEELIKIAKNTGLEIVLLPIGRAAMHSDQIPLSKIYEECKNKIGILMIEDNNVFDTMYIIANAKAYIGTSLHGAITAFSYGKPHVALTNKVKKLNDFLETWAPKENKKQVEIENLSSEINLLLNQDIKKIQESKDFCISHVKKNFENMNNIFKKEINE